jgi:hypothetical protein
MAETTAETSSRSLYLNIRIKKTRQRSVIYRSFKYIALLCTPHAHKSLSPEWNGIRVSDNPLTYLPIFLYAFSFSALSSLFVLSFYSVFKLQGFTYHAAGRLAINAFCRYIQEG